MADDDPQRPEGSDTPVGTPTPPPAATPEPPAQAAPPPYPEYPPPPAYPPPPPATPPPYSPPPAASPIYSPPPASSPVYSPPPAATPTQVPTVYAEQFGAPYAPYAPPPQAPARRTSGRTLLIIGIIAVVVLAALGGGGVLANASFSSTYSPQRAVSDYFSAMGRGDVTGMMANATFLSDDSGSSQFFTRDAVTAMMAADQNKQISNVKVGSASTVDDSTDSVGVTLSWGGVSRNLTYKVQKDSSRVHYLFYPSWRVQVPFTTLTFNVPNQAGRLQVDGLSLLANSKKTEAIQGFHSVTMQATDFYSANTQTADGVDSSPTIAFPTDISSTVKAAAAEAVKGAFQNETCDVTKYFDCPNHRYAVPAGSYDVLPWPGGDIRVNSWWSMSYRGDPTTGMTLKVGADAGKIDVAGTCGMTLTVDGNRTYQYAGTWSGTLTWSNGGFDGDILLSCDDSRV
jgi:hypothetical protein